MDDLGEVLTSGRSIMNLGGGNPGLIAPVQAIIRDAMNTAIRDGRFDDIVGFYDGPQGHYRFREALARLLNERYGWHLTVDNIAITAGSQASFFALFNLLAGPSEDDIDRHILLPLAPEYIGYADVGISADYVRSNRSRIELIGDTAFKYHVDFSRLTITEETAAVCVSRPTNPTGNVISDDELVRLSALTKEHGIPLIIDNAYGVPFPNIVFAEAEPIFADHIVLCMSLSKLGMPGLRTGIVIAAPEMIHAITSMNAITQLASSALGASLTAPLVESGENPDHVRTIHYAVLPAEMRRRACVVRTVLSWI